MTKRLDSFRPAPIQTSFPEKKSKSSNTAEKTRDIAARILTPPPEKNRNS